VGALTTADFRFGARPWELNAAASICTHCPVGCNLTLNTRREAKSGGNFVIKRVMPRQNEWVNELWICDKGRFSHHFTESEARLTQPLIRSDGELTPTTWEKALALVAEGFQAAEKDLVTLAGGRIANEDLFNLRRLSEHLDGQALLYTHMAGGDLIAQVGLPPGSNLGDLGENDAILVVACDLEEEAPVWWLRVKGAAGRGAALIVANPRPTKLDRYAQHVLRYDYGDEASTVKALENGEGAAGEALDQAENLLILFGSEGTHLEASQSLAQACADLLITKGTPGKINNGLLGVWPRANEQGAWDMGFRPPEGLNAAIEKAGALYIVAADPYGDNPALQPPHENAFVVVQELFLTPTAELAHVVLPAQAATEREGSFTSGERRVQRFYPAARAKGQSLPDFAITAQIGQRLGLDLNDRSPSPVMGQIASDVPNYSGISYQKLAQVSEQWPIIGRDDLYYGGTSYQNSQGLGVRLPLQEIAEPLTDMPEFESLPQADLVAIPITRLYDRGTMILPSDVLGPRIPDPYVVLNPGDAERVRAAQGMQVQVELDGASRDVIIQVDGDVPPGFVLVPRGMGVPIEAPSAIKFLIGKPVEA
jgi:NADH-quinone oxidoreductase subunit G